ncbi:MAG: ferric reductase-like transmembrane domain-containing protein [Bacteroidetes bacterium]|nr:ferric reductase-like transmembrane domain-containing protein [Bacteroidota bacterium]
MKKKNFGNLVIIGLVMLNFTLWVVFPPIYDGRPNFLRVYAGEVLGSTIIILMACGLVLAARPKWAEPYFGGLDKMYAAHKRANTSAFLLLFVHLLTVPITTDRLLVGTPIGIVAFLGIVTLVLLTLSPRIPLLSRLTNASYDKWKRTHRFIGIFYTLGFIHALFVDGLSALVAFSYVQFIFLIGLAAYLYTEVFSRFLNKSLPYRVSAVRRLNGNTAEVSLSSRGQRLAHQPGQFLFVRFPGDPVLDESHPFTISSAPDDSDLRLSIKASGDFTRSLHQNLSEGAEALVEGAYGLFQYQQGGQKTNLDCGGHWHHAVFIFYPLWKHQPRSGFLLHRAYPRGSPVPR